MNNLDPELSINGALQALEPKAERGKGRTLSAFAHTVASLRIRGRGREIPRSRSVAQAVAPRSVAFAVAGRYVCSTGVGGQTVRYT